MRGFGVRCDVLKTVGSVKFSRCVGAHPQEAEMAVSVRQHGSQQRPANAVTTARRGRIKPPHTADARLARVRVAVESADTHSPAVAYGLKQCFPRRVESIGA